MLGPIPVKCNNVNCCLKKAVVLLIDAHHLLSGRVMPAPVHCWRVTWVQIVACSNAGYPFTMAIQDSTRMIAAILMAVAALLICPTANGLTPVTPWESGFAT